MLNIGGVNINTNSNTIEDDSKYDFFSDFNQPVEEFAAPDELQNSQSEPIPEHQDISENTGSNLNQETAQMYADIKEQNAEISKELVEAADLLLAFLIAMFIAKDTDLAEKYKLPVESVERIARVAAKLMPQTKTVLPPSAELAVVIVGAYAPLIMQASLDRKEREKTEAERLRRIEIKKAQKRKAKMQVVKNEQAESKTDIVEN